MDPIVASAAADDLGDAGSRGVDGHVLREDSVRTARAEGACASVFPNDNHRVDSRQSDLRGALTTGGAAEGIAVRAEVVVASAIGGHVRGGDIEPILPRDDRPARAVSRKGGPCLLPGCRRRRDTVERPAGSKVRVSRNPLRVDIRRARSRVRPRDQTASLMVRSDGSVVLVPWSNHHGKPARWPALGKASTSRDADRIQITRPTAEVRPHDERAARAVGEHARVEALHAQVGSIRAP